MSDLRFPFRNEDPPLDVVVCYIAAPSWMSVAMDSGVEVVNEDGIPVKLPSGAEFKVLTSVEVDYLKDLVKRYLTDNVFKNVSDLQDIDRMLMLEVLVWRYQCWLGRGKDYFDEAIDDRGIRLAVEKFSKEIRDLKKSLGLDKVSRDKAKGEDSVVEYITQLGIRAKEFGVHRETQSAKAIELWMQLRGLVQRHTNCTIDEQREQACTMEDIFEWLHEIAFPEFDKIDQHFKSNNQKYWIRKL